MNKPLVRPRYRRIDDEEKPDAIFFFSHLGLTLRPCSFFLSIFSFAPSFTLRIISSWLGEAKGLICAIGQRPSPCVTFKMAKR